MQKLFFTLAFFLMGTILTAAPLVWNSRSGLDKWQAKENVKLLCSKGILKLSEIKRDPQIISPVINLDPTLYNRVSITYRGWNIPSRTTGQLYYSHGNNRFMRNAFWRIPRLKGDGKWHTVVLTEKSLVSPNSWYRGGPVNRLRLDPYDAAGGTLEIKEIKFFKAAAVLPPKAFRKIPPYPTRWDEPRWPAVKPEFKKNRPLETYNCPYFAGKMIKSPLDTGSRQKDVASKTFFLRKNINLKAKPVTAWVQFNADDGAHVYFNGKLGGSNVNWRVPTAVEVSADLKKGPNVWAFCYSNGYGAGGVMGELYVEYADGSFERFDTDEKFIALAKSTPDWNSALSLPGSYEKVIALPGAPHPPWKVQLAYKDFRHPQHFVKGTLSSAVPEAGERVKIRFSFKGRIPKLPFDGDIVIKRENIICWKEKITVQKDMISKGRGNSWDLAINYTLPLYNNGGKSELSLESGAIFCQSGGAPQITFDMKRPQKFPGFSKAPKVKVAKINGTPRFVINERPIYPLWLSSEKVTSQGYANVITVNSSYGSWWSGINKIDYPSFDYYAERASRKHPGAWFVWDLNLYPPAEWAKKYPEELCRDNTGAIVRDGFISYSFASKRALADIIDTMVKVVTYLERSPYANRIIGYRLNGGHTIEWLGWDFPKGRMVDYSKPAREGFRAFAAKNYPQLKDRSLPSLADHSRTVSGGLLRDPEKNLKSIAYMDFYSQNVADMIIAITRRARKIVPDKLLGTYYGYSMTLPGSGVSQFRAHYALKKLLAAGCVDFLSSPQAYGLRKVGDSCIDMKPFRTMQNRNVVPTIEDDTRTHNAPFMTYSNNFQAFTEKQTVNILRRNMGIALCRLLPCHFSCYPGPLSMDFPAMKNEFAVLRVLGDHISEKARRNAEIAYVVSEETVKNMPMHSNSAAPGEYWQFYKPDGTPYAVKRRSRALHSDIYGENLTRCARMGAAVDYLLAEELHKSAHNYKLYIFANCLTYDEKFLETVKKLRRKNCTLLWVYAPGLIFKGKSSLANMERLTGFKFKRSAEFLLPQLTTAQGKVGTPSKRLGPLFSVIPAPGVKALGYYEDKSVGFALRKNDKAVDIFCGIWQFDVPFLTRLAEKAGVHIYQKHKDPMESNSHLVTLHARFPGKKVITLPRPATVLDVYNARIIGKNLRKFSFDAPLHSSHLFYTGNDAEVLLEKLKQKHK